MLTVIKAIISSRGVTDVSAGLYKSAYGVDYRLANFRCCHRGNLPVGGRISYTISVLLGVL